MGVTGIAQYKQAMSQASQSVKTLDAALKLNEKQLQATGDKEVYMQQKSKLLQQQIAAQTNVVKQGQAALTAMEKQGVKINWLPFDGTEEARTVEWRKQKSIELIFNHNER